jgi:hypothetical protein
MGTSSRFVFTLIATLPGLLHLIAYRCDRSRAAYRTVPTSFQKESLFLPKH